MKSNTICTKFAKIEPKGYITAANAGEFQQQLILAVTSQAESILLVDMNQLEFLDSAGLVALISAFREAQGLKRRFTLCSLSPSVRIIFELTQLDRIFEIFENRDAFELALS